MITIGTRKLPVTSLVYIKGLTGSEIVDESPTRGTLTLTNAAMSSGITPLFGGTTSPRVETDTGKISYTSKRRTGSYNTPFTVEMFISPVSDITTANSGCVFCAETTANTNMANGDWMFAFYLGALRFQTWTGSTSNCYRINLNSGNYSLDAGVWYHMFIQVNSDGTHTCGLASLADGSTGTAINGTPTTLSQGSTLIGYGIGPASGGWGGGIGFYFQGYRVTDGIARYPTSGTYKIPTFPGM